MLPNGLRRYNALLITGICTAVIGLFLFAKPLAELLKELFSLLLGGIFLVFDSLNGCVHEMPEDIPTGDPNGIVDLEKPKPTSLLAEIAFVLLIIGMLVLIFKMRRQIWSSLRSFFAPLFRRSDESADLPFSDEILNSDAKSFTSRSRRRAERELIRRYSRESDPALKYRCGYALFLMRLGRTSSPPLPADTTTVHREKGESEFERDLGELSEVYNRVRYGENTPTAEELARQEELLAEIRKAL